MSQHHYSSSRSSDTEAAQRQAQDLMFWIYMFVGFIYGFLPAIPAGYWFFNHINRQSRYQRRWYWLGGVLLGTGVCLLLYYFGHLQDSIIAYLDAWKPQIVQLWNHHTFNLGAVFSVTLLLWLKTIGTFPVFTVLAWLSETRSTSRRLRDQIEEDDYNRWKASERAARQMSGKPIPGALGKQSSKGIVLGKPIRKRDQDEAW